MFAIILPVAASALIGPLLFYQRKAKKKGVLITQKITIYDFCSQIDLGGSFLLAAGLAMFLLPFTIAGATTAKWAQGHIIALIVVGFVTLAGLVAYEHFFATHPILPARYFKNLTIVLSCSLGFLDVFGFASTHTYLYPWAVIVHVSVNLNTHSLSLSSHPFRRLITLTNMFLLEYGPSRSNVPQLHQWSVAVSVCNHCGIHHVQDATVQVACGNRSSHQNDRVRIDGATSWCQQQLGRDLHRSVDSGHVS